MRHSMAPAQRYNPNTWPASAARDTHRNQFNGSRRRYPSNSGLAWHSSSVVYSGRTSSSCLARNYRGTHAKLREIFKPKQHHTARSRHSAGRPGGCKHYSNSCTKIYTQQQIKAASRTFANPTPRLELDSGCTLSKYQGFCNPHRYRGSVQQHPGRSLHSFPNFGHN